jgi:hypothetical protein
MSVIYFLRFVCYTVPRHVNKRMQEMSQVALTYLPVQAYETDLM